jgi:hypothetical protein
MGINKCQRRFRVTKCVYQLSFGESLNVTLRGEVKKLLRVTCYLGSGRATGHRGPSWNVINFRSSKCIKHGRSWSPPSPPPLWQVGSDVNKRNRVTIKTCPAYSSFIDLAANLNLSSLFGKFRITQNVLRIMTYSNMWKYILYVMYIIRI